MAPTLLVGTIVPYLTATNIAALTIGLYTIYFITGSIYNIYFHPLSRYPGPKQAAITKHWISLGWVGGRYHHVIKDLHDKYGTVVRIGPNELSYSSSTSWKEIYGHVGGRKQFLKTEFYDDGTAANIVSERDPHKHGKLRRLLSNGFSAKALAEQEVVVHGYVDQLITQINTHATGHNGDSMVKWYNFCTFDIIGDLAFGDPFGSLSDGKPHFWVVNILGSIEALIWIFVLQKSDLLKALIPMIIPKRLKVAREKHFQYCEDKIIKRIQSQNPKKDLLSLLVEKQKSGDEISIEQMRGNASVLVVAGSETTATFLTAVSYSLCNSPDVYKKLVEEIRGNFTSYDQINSSSTERLAYVRAVVDEGLRIYPPVPAGLPRMSPGETIDGIFVPRGTVVSTSGYTATHSEENFHRPYDFLPERWIDPDCKDKKEASQPFSLGSRVCIGRSLALMEMRVILCKMLWTFDMELVNPEFDWIKNSRSHVVWNKPELQLRYTRRPGVVVPPLDG